MADPMTTEAAAGWQAWLDTLPPHDRAQAERDLAHPPSREEIRDALADPDDDDE